MEIYKFRPKLGRSCRCICLQGHDYESVVELFHLKCEMDNQLHCTKLSGSIKEIQDSNPNRLLPNCLLLHQFTKGLPKFSSIYFSFPQLSKFTTLFTNLDCILIYFLLFPCIPLYSLVFSCIPFGSQILPVCPCIPLNIPICSYCPI